MNNHNKSLKLTKILGIYVRADTPKAFVAVLITSMVHDKVTKELEMVGGESFMLIMN